MLEQIMDEFYAVFADNNLTGNIYTEEDLMVEGDPDKLARVFDNLLRNAVAYSYRGTNIDVRAYGEGVAVVIVFSNQESRSRNRNCRPYLKSSTVRIIPDRARPEEPDLDFRWQRDRGIA